MYPYMPVHLCLPLCGASVMDCQLLLLLLEICTESGLVMNCPASFTMGVSQKKDGIRLQNWDSAGLLLSDRKVPNSLTVMLAQIANSQEPTILWQVNVWVVP